MDKMYNDAKDKNVAAYIAYASADAGFVFKDAKKSQKMTKEEVTDLFYKGLIVNLNNELHRIVHLKANGSGVNIVGYNGTKAITFKSAEVE